MATKLTSNKSKEKKTKENNSEKYEANVMRKEIEIEDYYLFTFLR